MSRLQHQVAQFHQEFGHPIGDAPHVPPDERVRFRLRLIAEEFFEAIAACGSGEGAILRHVDSIRSEMQCIVDWMPLSVSLPEFADALGDLDYVVEGCRLECGIDGDPVAYEIHDANMRKRGAGKREDSKQLKPEGWKPPDIEGVLMRQGSLRAKLQGPG